MKKWIDPLPNFLSLWASLRCFLFYWCGFEVERSDPRVGKTHWLEVVHDASNYVLTRCTHQWRKYVSKSYVNDIEICVHNVQRLDPSPPNTAWNITLCIIYLFVFKNVLFIFCNKKHQIGRPMGEEGFETPEPVVIPNPPPPFCTNCSLIFFTDPMDHPQDVRPWPVEDSFWFLAFLCKFLISLFHPFL